MNELLMIHDRRMRLFVKMWGLELMCQSSGVGMRSDSGVNSSLGHTKLSALSKHRRCIE